jgi:hypothetical protein
MAEIFFGWSQREVWSSMLFYWKLRDWRFLVIWDWGNCICILHLPWYIELYMNGLQVHTKIHYLTSFDLLRSLRINAQILKSYKNLSLWTADWKEQLKNRGGVRKNLIAFEIFSELWSPLELLQTFSSPVIQSFQFLSEFSLSNPPSASRPSHKHSPNRFNSYWLTQKNSRQQKYEK